MIEKKGTPKKGNKNKATSGKHKKFKAKPGKHTNKKGKKVQAVENPLEKNTTRRYDYSKWSRNTTGSKKEFESPVEKLVLTEEWLKISRQRLAEHYNRTVVMTMPRALRLNDKDLKRLMKDALSIKFTRDENGAYIYLEYESPFDAKMKKAQLETLEFSGQKVTAEISSETAPSAVNPYILYVDYIPVEATFDDVQTAFPTASHIKVKLGYRSDLARKSAILFYEDKNVAGQIFQHADKTEIRDTKVPVTFIKYGETKKNKRSRDEKTEKEEPKAKKSKVVNEEVKEIKEEGKTPIEKKKKKKRGSKTGQKKDSNE